MATEDDAIVENALQHLGSVAERLDHYVSPAEGQPPASPSYTSIGSKASGSPIMPRKRVKGHEGDSEGKKPKKTRQTQSCDACRARKVKCDRPPPGSAGVSHAPTKDVCTHCRQLGMACTFEYKPKKRGPPNMYLKRMQALNHKDERPMYSPTYGNGRREDEMLAGPGPGTLASQDALRVGRRDGDDWASLGRGFTAQDQRDLLLTGRGNGYSLSPSFLSPLDSPDDRALYPARNPPQPLRDPQATPAVNPIDAVLPRHILYGIIDVYFDYIYCLIPCVHKPSFMRDLDARREEQPDQEEFVALVFAIVETTLMQMPRLIVGMPKEDTLVLFEDANALVKQYLDREFTNLTVTRCIIYYLHTVAHNHLPNKMPNSINNGANFLLSLKLRLHEEAGYKDLNPIERELRKRIFWLQYGADKTLAALDMRISIFHEIDCGDVTLPSPLDDEYLTEQAYLEQPEGETPLLAGFYYISKLFRLLGQVLDKRKHDRVKPPQGLMLQMRINEIDTILHQVLTLMDNSPEALRLDMGGSPSARMQRVEERWDAHVNADISQLLRDPGRARHASKDTFLVQQANIYVTQQMVRYIILQYSEDLAALHDKELAQDEPPGSGTFSLPTRRPVFTETEKDTIVSDLLVILSKIPLEVIAINTVSLVAKVRYVASTLLDALQSEPPDPSDIPQLMRSSQRAARAQGYLWDFLRILTDIENLFNLADSSNFVGTMD
ncbi:uncharacterized protein CcaverHIS019_0505640 [Cutaneotrichosporon cavernicola]|uniref:Zn(2)-C6 fungal-type domain-containing protein n=1 Tax=Cutaneotrichosporon cavernicola TaxID=279322 RepID=A0AA48L6Q0_9TREE|nr:uncharacterized protein CcaverHIS019_0505640 [Cutaneotrichosporon cavernicola]BEI92936.1 hypothetical protein CcaverHIS019_0505640 [Cutaneotrichosporon cavernicola]BEJ00712.1 hypothetical protein CcaverHIS631_0505690 [Cutaneotrichosporon cavernicola]BEJ08479.1 hypothetical protein CcaverHIS641_0505730 [Cutaneotrichosporon cavernicola]